MGLFDFLRRPAPIRDTGELAEFVDRQAAFVAQKGIYEYARARAGHYAKVLFQEPEFLAACDVSRWQTYPLGLAMVAEVVDGVLLPAWTRERPALAEAIRALTLSVFDSYPAPAALISPTWAELRAELDQRLKLIGLHPPKWAKDIPEPYWQKYFDLMPIHEKMRTKDAPTTHNYLRVVLINVHDVLSKRLDVASVARSLEATGGQVSLPPRQGLNLNV
jgi:hypothetical protein